MSDASLISVIDDDEAVRVSLGRLIRSAGFRVETFASAESFLGSTARGDSICVITDLEMPGGMDGLELLQEINNAQNTLPVILISGFLEGRRFDEASAAQPYCLLKKPFDGDRLIACVESAVQR